MKASTFLLALFAVTSIPVHAQPAPPPPLPALMADCKQDMQLASASYTSCFAPPGKSYYGRLFLRSEMPELNFEQMATTLDKAGRKSLWGRVKSFFLSKYTEGSLVATVRLMPSRTVIGIFELAKFNRSDKGKQTLTQSSVSYNGYQGPYFNTDNGKASIEVNVQYVFKKTHTSNISYLIGEATKLLSAERILSAKPILSDATHNAVRAVETAIVSQADVQAAVDNTIQLSFDPVNTMAAYRSISFGTLANNRPGQLFLAAVPLRSALINLSPRELDKQSYTGAGYGAGATDPIQSAVVEGRQLREIVSEKMGDEYEALRSNKSTAAFLAACTKLRTVLESAELNLNTDDKIASEWAFIVGNPLMKRKDIRDGYCLAASEKSGDFARLQLDMPEVDATPLSAEQEALVASAMAAADKAFAADVAAQSAVNLANEAMNRANLPVPPAGYGRSALCNCTYRGQTPSADQPFFGTLVDLSAANANNLYEGRLILSGGAPRFDGLGRYTPAPGAPGYDYKDYAGDFSANYFSGYGVMRWAGGRSFHGMFTQDKPSGYGIVTEADGTRYFARFVDGKGDGATVKRTVDGKMIAGRWVSGQFLPNS